ncbi:MAG: hypothetical protein IIB16_04500 [Chloroflexi bacterium]|nr:hypothetical protein [Chloroflexota bacterium]
MDGWRITQHAGRSKIFKVLLAAILVLSITAIPLPQTSGWWQGQAEAAPPDDTPKGQLKRRGIVGVVLSVEPFSATSTPPHASSTPPIVGGPATSTPPVIPPTGQLMIVGMQHGNVRVVVPDGLRIHAPQQEDILLKDTLGMKVAVLADKPPIDPFANDGDDEVIRTVTAKKIMIVPGEAYRTHGRGLVTAGKGKGKFKLLGENGEEQEIEIEDGDGLEEGDDIIFIKPKRGHGNASSTPLFINLRGLKNASHIADRLTKLTDRLLQAGDSPALERLLKKVDKFQDRVDKRLEKLEREILRLESKGVKFAPKVHGKFRKNDDGVSNSGRGKGRIADAPTVNGNTADTDGDEPGRGRGKGRSLQASDGDEDGQSGNRNRNRNRNRNGHADTVDCADYENADPADVPTECQDEEEDTTSLSSSGKGKGKVSLPGRGRRN